MKAILTLLSFFCLASTAFTQENFEGVIRFHMTSKDSAVNVHITAFFKKDKIKFATEVLSSAPGVDAKNETIIINFRDSLIERIKFEEKFVETEKMQSDSTGDFPQLKRDSTKTEILGYECTLFTTGNITKIEQKSGQNVETNVNIRICYARDLYFRIQPGLRTVQMVPLFTNDHIALGSTIQIESDGQKYVLVTRAISIEKKTLEWSVFELPANFPVRASD